MAAAHYAQTYPGFPTDPTVGPLTAPATGNGVYGYGPGGFGGSVAGTFPANYFVDPIFEAATATVQPNTAGTPWTTCIALENSHLHDLAAAGQLSGNNSLMTGNEVDHFGDDGLDYGANNIALTNNYIHDNFDRGDGNHEDGMQGIIALLGAGVPYNAYSNILIKPTRRSPSRPICKGSTPSMKIGRT